MADVNDLLKRWNYDPSLMGDPNAPSTYKLSTQEPPPERPAPHLEQPPRPDDPFLSDIRNYIGPNAQAQGAHALGEIVGNVTAPIFHGEPGKAIDPALEGAPVAAAAILGTRAKTTLPMDEASRQARAQARFGDIPDTFFHGTTHKFPYFADPIKNPKNRFYDSSWHGPAIYMSSSESDAGDNYAGIGPDLRNKLDYISDQYRGAGHSPADIKMAHKLIDQGYLPANAMDNDLEGAVAYARAFKQMVGNIPEGRVLPLRINPHKPIWLGGPNEEFFRFDHPEPTVKPEGEGFRVYHTEGHEYYPGRVMTEREANDLVDEERYNYDPKSALMDAIAKLRDEEPNEHVREAYNRFISDMYTEMMDRGGLKASEFDSHWRSSPVALAALDYGQDQYHSPGVVYRALGHDAVIMPNAERQFPGMGMPRDTTHVALFDPRRVRDADLAVFDPKKINSRNLLAGIGAGSMIAPGLMMDNGAGDAEKREGHWDGGVPANRDDTDPAPLNPYDAQRQRISKRLETQSLPEALIDLNHHFVDQMTSPPTAGMPLTRPTTTGLAWPRVLYDILREHSREHMGMEREGKLDGGETKLAMNDDAGRYHGQGESVWLLSPEGGELRDVPYSPPPRPPGQYRLDDGTPAEPPKWHSPREFLDKGWTFDRQLPPGLSTEEMHELLRQRHGHKDGGAERTPDELYNYREPVTGNMAESDAQDHELYMRHLQDLIDTNQAYGTFDPAGDLNAMLLGGGGALAAHGLRGLAQRMIGQDVPPAWWQLGKIGIGGGVAYKGAKGLDLPQRASDFVNAMRARPEMRRQHHLEEPGFQEGGVIQKGYDWKDPAIQFLGPRPHGPLSDYPEFWNEHPDMLDSVTPQEADKSVKEQERWRKLIEGATPEALDRARKALGPPREPAPKLPGAPGS